MRFGRTGSRLFEPVDPASLAFFRVAFGLILLVGVLRYFLVGKIDEYYVQPRFHFTYYGFEWVRPWPELGMYAHFAVLAIAATLLALGIAYRAAAALFATGFTYVFLLEKARYLNHHYLILLLAWLLVLVPAQRAFSVGSRFGGGPCAVPYWSLFLLRAQIGLVYFFAGVAKLNGDWLRALPLRMWLPERSGHPLIGELLAQEWVAWAFSYGGLALDLLAWPLLAWRATRRIAFVLLAAFHLTNATLFGIGLFPWIMIAATTLFFAPDWPRRFLGSGEALEPLPPTTRLRRRALATFLTVYLAAQLLIPLRHYLYPGYVSWTEEGHRFAWHMKLRDKEAQATFFVRDPETGERWQVDPNDVLAPWQAHTMAGRPEMVREFAAHLARSPDRPGRVLEVRASVYAALNGRTPEPLVDPAVDLARETRGLWHTDWILPLNAPAP